jgi:hypothetical protein
MTMKTSNSQPESTIFYTAFNPTIPPVQFLHHDTALLKFAMPRHHHCCRSTAPSQHALSSIPEVITADFETQPLCLPRTANAVCNLSQQESTVLSPTSHPTLPQVPILHKPTLFLKSKTPRCPSTTPIRHWLPCLFQDSCFFSIDGHFLSFPGFNSLLPVTLLQPVLPFVHNRCARHLLCAASESPNSTILQQFASISAPTTTISLENRMARFERNWKKCTTSFAPLP